MKAPSFITVSGLFVCATPALAHTELSATVPADQAIIEEAPEDLQLTFSEAVRLTAISIQLDGAPKHNLGPLPPETTRTFTLDLPALADGHYIVSWRALSEDTHVMNGEFMFAIGAEGSHTTHMDHDSAQPEQEDHAAH